MKRKLLQKQNRFIASLLSVLGVGGTFTFYGCDIDNHTYEYGTPHADFKVHGKISNEENVGIQGIRVKFWLDEEKHYADTVYTGADGLYNVKTVDWPSDKNYPVEFDDVDGESNGNYNSLDTIVSFVNPEFKNPDGHWYKGETSKEFNIKLKDKD